MADRPQGLIADSSRQAPDTIRGFVFQLWHSVHAWLELGEGDQLFLEGAEDFDVLSAQGAIVNQTKATSAGISLRSAAVLQAIRNFWFVRERNRAVRISYRFITTSPVVQERGAPFGDIAGLNLWNECRAGSPSNEQIRAFLRDGKYFDGLLGDFVNHASEQELFDELVSRISWDTAQLEQSSVVDAVKRKLVSHGDKYSVLPSEAEKIAHRLFTEVAAVASSKELRQLGREDFLRIFEEETQQLVPISQHRAALSALATAVGGTKLPESNVILSASSVIQKSPPPLPTIASRECLLRELHGRLSSKGLLILQGSSGTGKTFLAALLSHNKKNFGWLMLRGLSGREARIVLHAVSQLIDSESNLNFVVLDDLDLSPDSANHYRDLLTAIAYTIRARRGQLLITSQRRVPASVAQMLDADPICEFNVPNLTREELQELALKLGCPTSSAQQHAAFVEIQTSGHPQLAHARLLTLSRAGWPDAANAALALPSSDLAQLKTEARQLIRDLSAGEIELLYRLSLIGGTFRRDHAIRVGILKPEVTLSADCFDHLVGPWIEQINESYYRLSPLLDNSGVEVWPHEKVKRLREVIGGAVLACGKLSMLEVSRLVMLALQSQSAGLAITIGSIVIRQSPKIKKQLAEHLSWLEFLPSDKPIFPGSGLANWTMRTLQLIGATDRDCRLGEDFVAALESEMTEARMGAAYHAPRFTALVGVLGASTIKMSPKQLVHVIGEIISLKVELQTELKKTDFRLKAFGRDYALGTYAFALVAFRCGDTKFLDELLEAIQLAGRTILSHFRSFFKELPTASRLLVDRAWLGDEDKKIDPETTVTVMERAVKFGRMFDVPELSDVALRALVLVCDEYLNDQSRAVKKLEEFRPNVASCLLKDEEATLLLHQKRHEEALDIWETILPQWKLEPDAENSPIIAFGWRKAGMAAGLANQWERAAKLLLGGAKAATEVKNQVLHAALLADSAYASWKADDIQSAVSKLAVAIEKLDKIPDTKDELQAFKVRKTLGQTLIHIHHSLEGIKTDPSAFVLPPAFCSDPGLSDKLRDLPDSDQELLWMFLVLIEALARLKPVVYKKVYSKLNRSRNTAVRLFLAEVTLMYTIYSADEAVVPVAAEEFARVFRITKANVITGKRPLTLEPSVFKVPATSEDFALTVHGLYAALVSNFCRTSLEISELQNWKKWSKKLATASQIQGWIEIAERLLWAPTSEAMKVLYDPNETAARRAIAAINDASAKTLSPDQLFYSQLMILWGMADNPLQRFLGVELGAKFAQQWIEKIKFTGLLRSPRLTVPMIEKACSEVYPAMQKPARILLAVEPAISLRIPEEVRQKLQAWAQLPSIA
jgi:hypothetical protein